MRIFFEDHKYPISKIDPILGGMRLLLPDYQKGVASIKRVGYIFVNQEAYKGPVFILPKCFLIDVKGKMCVLGWEDIYPEDVIDTDDPDNPLELKSKGTFLPELSLWLFRAIKRFYEEHSDTTLGEEADIDPLMPNEDSSDKDFLSTALDLIDFLRDHRNLFTQITLINHSGRDKIDWQKTVQGDPFVQDGKPWYLDPSVKDKVIDIDDTLIIIYYSVLAYLRDKYRFPIKLDQVPYTLLTVSEIQDYIDNGIGEKEMRRIRGKYFRDDLKHLWGLLDAFFANNVSNEDKSPRREQLLIRQFSAVYEAMIDRLISDSRGVEKLKDQKDGKLIDHIFRGKSIVGSKHDIYYIADSKYYRDDLRPEGVALYKQFTYAKNTIQYIIDNLYLTEGKSKGNLRYRDTLTEGYNISPNFFIRSRVEDKDRDYGTPSLNLTYWDESKHQQYPPTNKHFEDRIFDRDTLILREFSINLLFVIAIYAGYEEEYWTSSLHTTIREKYIESIDSEYDFYLIKPKDENVVMFWRLFFEHLNGRSYLLEEAAEQIVIAFSHTKKGEEAKAKLLAYDLRSVETGKLVEYDMTPTSLAKLSNQ